MDGKDFVYVTDYISKEALLEQTAEEAAELAQACLKMARKLRDENPTPKTMDEIIVDLNEEMADVMICMDAIVESGIISNESIDSVAVEKYERWTKRLQEKGEE